MSRVLTTYVTTFCIDGEVVMPLKYVVKKIKGHYYVYLQGRVNGEVKTIYIGSLDKIAEHYIRSRQENWCGGWDLNPRRPTPSGPQPHTPLPDHQYSSSKQHELTTSKSVDEEITSRKLAKFLKWCIDKGTSEETCRQYARYLRKPFNPSNKWSRLAYKAWYKFLGREDKWKEIKVKKSGIDLYIPSDEDVVETLLKARETPTVYTVYKILVESGARLREVIKMLNELEGKKLIKHGGFYKYPLSWRRGSKQVFYIYMIEKPEKLDISYKWITNWIGKHDVLPAKAIRKWVATKMLSLGIPEEIVNYIQGRIPQEILSKHYLKLTTLADQYYTKYAAWLRETLAKVLGENN